MKRSGCTGQASELGGEFPGEHNNLTLVALIVICTKEHKLKSCLFSPYNITSPRFGNW